MTGGPLLQLVVAPLLAVALFAIPAGGALPSPVAAASAPAPDPAPVLNTRVLEGVTEPLPVAAEPVSAMPAETLPWITSDGVIPSAPADPGTPFTGQLAAPKADGLTVYEAPGGKPFGLLPTRSVDSEGSDRTWMPVIGSSAGGWLEVLLPARRNLPSTGAPVNGAAGWIRTSEALAKASAVAVDVDLTARTVTVTDAGTATAAFPVAISGDMETVRGRSFVMGRYATLASLHCSAEQMLVLSAQSESADGYFGQATAVQAVHAFSENCRRI
ncbi:MAG TPA: hypothetical protein VF867_00005, partial [Arthrobacter sp.]